jgi:hypothetical protein
MAKNYNKGADVRLYYDTANSFGSPTWVAIPAAGDIDIDPNFDDVKIPERGADMGHLHGEKDWSFKFTLFEDSGDANVVAMITAMWAGTSIHLAVANGAIATTGTKYVHGDCLLSGPEAGHRGDPHSYDITAQKHANSPNNLTRVMV